MDADHQKDDEGSKVIDPCDAGCGLGFHLRLLLSCTLPSLAIPTQFLDALNFTDDVHPFIKGKPSLQNLLFIWFAVGEFGVRMHTGAWSVGPSSVVGRPSRNGPSSSVFTSAGHVRVHEQFVFVRDLVKAG